MAQVPVLLRPPLQLLWLFQRRRPPAPRACCRCRCPATTHLLPRLLTHNPPAAQPTVPWHPWGPWSIMGAPTTPGARQATWAVRTAPTARLGEWCVVGFTAGFAAAAGSKFPSWIQMSNADRTCMSLHYVPTSNGICAELDQDWPLPPPALFLHLLAAPQGTGGLGPRQPPPTMSASLFPEVGLSVQLFHPAARALFCSSFPVHGPQNCSKTLCIAGWLLSRLARRQRGRQWAGHKRGGALHPRHSVLLVQQLWWVGCACLGAAAF